ncbi:hypothetical protein J6590_051321 [Homalodisca vitripennis]|nr:hypothetical protein J6590_051321 [Homalodisca vitripennis]
MKPNPRQQLIDCFLALVEILSAAVFNRYTSTSILIHEHLNCTMECVASTHSYSSCRVEEVKSNPRQQLIDCSLALVEILSAAVFNRYTMECVASTHSYSSRRVEEVKSNPRQQLIDCSLALVEILSAAVFNRYTSTSS